jgi:hypothetical protein
MSRFCSSPTRNSKSITRSPDCRPFSESTFIKFEPIRGFPDFNDRIRSLKIAASLEWRRFAKRAAKGLPALFDAEHLTVSISLDPADRPAKGEQHRSGWWPLDCLRSLGRAASIAAGAPPDLQLHSQYRGFGIFTTGQDGAYCARILQDDGRAVQTGEQLRRYIDAAKFDSREEAILHARFVIASGALNHLLHNPAGKAA